MILDLTDLNNTKGKEIERRGIFYGNRSWNRNGYIQNGLILPRESTLGNFCKRTRAFATVFAIDV